MIVSVIPPRWIQAPPPPPHTLTPAACQIAMLLEKQEEFQGFNAVCALDTLVCDWRPVVDEEYKVLSLNLDSVPFCAKLPMTAVAEQCTESTMTQTLTVGIGRLHRLRRKKDESSTDIALESVA